ncbi:MAG: hypothetical protein CL707_07890 [Chloroflexi bacterium]|nr:hypothetical protein [Chloroflexota bacterium]|tara:strand:+ start:2796 stop:3050 length:255 start_codon:yes stop_codon:yes gene_type:complete
MEISVNSTTQKRVTYDTDHVLKGEKESSDRYLSVHINSPTVAELLDILRVAAEEVGGDAVVWSQISDSNRWYITCRERTEFDDA